MDRDAPTPAEIRRALAECMTLADIDDAMGWLPGTAGRRRWRVPAAVSYTHLTLPTNREV